MDSENDLNAWKEKARSACNKMNKIWRSNLPYNQDTTFSNKHLSNLFDCDVKDCGLGKGK